MDLTQIKVVLLGDAFVGKSSILYRFMTGGFKDDGDPTVGASFIGKIITVKDKSVKLNIWDTAGQERYNSFAKMYCRDARAVIFVFDCSKIQTFHSLERWSQLLADSFSELPPRIYIAANKCDLHTFDEYPQDILDFSYKVDSKIYQVSAKLNIGIEELFTRIAENALFIPNLNRRISLSPEKHSSSTVIVKKSKCC